MNCVIGGPSSEYIRGVVVRVNVQASWLQVAMEVFVDSSIGGREVLGDFWVKDDPKQAVIKVVADPDTSTGAVNVGTVWDVCQ